MEILLYDKNNGLNIYFQYERNTVSLQYSEHIKHNPSSLSIKKRFILVL